MSPNEANLPHHFSPATQDKSICRHCGLSEHATIHPKNGHVEEAVDESRRKIYQEKIETRIWPPSMEKVEFKSGVTSTKQVRLSLIPHAGLVRAAKRFELGLERHGEHAWNALSTNQEALRDKDWLIERCSHAVEHCYSLIDKLKGEKPFNEGEDDAGAIAWCGLVLGEAMERFEREEKNGK